MKKTKAAQMPLFHLEKPNLSKVDRQKIVSELEKNPGKYREIFEKANEPIYKYWDEFRYKFTDHNLNSEELWYLVRQFRNISALITPIISKGGECFRWLRLPSTEECLHNIDMLVGGQLFPQSDALSEKNRQIYINRGILEEAIASSQLEGAHTTRKAAKKMLLEKIPPQNPSEQMILNNYTAINAIEEEYKNKPLSLDLLFELHRILTKNTIDKSEQNRLRKDQDEIVVEGQIGNEQYIGHIPPPEKFIVNQIKNLIAYANDESGERFIHPIIKAMFLHFWIGYLHPFTDGNGRLARALFYWYLLRKGYWTFMYLPISTVIKKAPKQYAMAYIYSEQDNHDLTYFFNFHIRKIIQAIDEFKIYIDRKVQENKAVTKLISKTIPLNERQKQLIYYLISDPNSSTTVSSQANFNNISRQTAAKDLKQLEAAKLVFSRREGKYIRYYPRTFNKA